MPSRVLVAGHKELDAYLKPYGAAVEAAGGLPSRLWPNPGTLADPAALERFLLRFDGLLLPGGKDVLPEHYGAPAHPRLGQTDALLDAGQLALARLAARLRFPTFGICRGIQVVAVALGQTLYQDLPTERPGPLTHHRVEGAESWHEVRVAAGSRLRAIVNADELDANSSHHQALRETTPGRVGPLVVTARAPDDVVEAAEHPDWPELLAVQWHPERMWAEHESARALFRAFLESCAGRRQAR